MCVMKCFIYKPNPIATFFYGLFVVVAVLLHVALVAIRLYPLFV